MKSLIFASFTLLPFLIQARPFTNTAGKTIEAEITRATETDVWLRTTNGKVAKVPLSALSEKDQAFIKTWLKDALLNVKIEPKLARGLKKAKDTTKWASKQNFVLTVDFRNDSANLDLEDSEATLFLVGQSTADEKIYRILAKVTKSISLPSNGSDTLEFPRIESYYSDRKGFHAISYVLEVKRKRDDKQLHLSSPNAFLKKRMAEITARQANDSTDSTFVKIVEAEGSQFETQVDLIEK